MNIYRIIFILGTIYFIFLCLLHYFSLRPLWLDEGFILENMRNLTYKQLLGSLNFSQAFPRIYLILIKYFSQRFNFHLLSLRAFPLISMLLAFFFWRKIYFKEFSSKWNSLLAIFSFTGSFSLSYYAAELKHYSMDVLVVGIFCLYFFYQRQNMTTPPSKAFSIVTLLLPFTLFFSYSSFFVFWMVIYNFLFYIKRNLKFINLLIAYTAECFLILSFVYLADLRHTLKNASLFHYWQSYFLCTDSFYCFIKSFGEGLRRLSAWCFGNNKLFMRTATLFLPFFVFSVFVYGLRSLKKDRFKIFDIHTVALVIFFEFFILGLIKKYPFTGERITLFFAPFVFFLIIRGFGSLRKYKPLYLGFNVGYVVFIFICSANSFLTYLKFYD